MVENMAPNTTLPSSMNVLPAAHRLRIAFVCSRLPLPMTRADQLTVAHLISYLAARGHSLDLFTLDTGEKPTPEQRAWLDQRCRQLLVFRQPMARSILGLIRAVAVTEHAAACERLRQAARQDHICGGAGAGTSLRGQYMARLLQDGPH